MQTVYILLYSLWLHRLRECVYTWPVLYVQITYDKYKINISHVIITCHLGPYIAWVVTVLLYSQQCCDACLVNTNWPKRDWWTGERWFYPTDFYILLRAVAISRTTIKIWCRIPAITSVTNITRFSIKLYLTRTQIWRDSSNDCIVRLYLGQIYCFSCKRNNLQHWIFI
jgi:hypothetical protein